MPAGLAAPARQGLGGGSKVGQRSGLALPGGYLSIRAADSPHRFMRPKTVALLAAAMLAVPAPAAALNIFGLHLFERQDAEEELIGTPQPYTVEFIVASGDRDMEKALKGASSLWADRQKPASGAAGLIAKARSDYRRLLNTLYAAARYGGTISITIDGREADSLLPDVELASPAAVRVTVDPGPLFHFSAARSSLSLASRTDVVRLR